jgi:hypothetical protein
VGYLISIYKKKVVTDVLEDRLAMEKDGFLLIFVKTH